MADYTLSSIAFIALNSKLELQIIRSDQTIRPSVRHQNQAESNLFSLIPFYLQPEGVAVDEKPFS